MAGSSSGIVIVGAGQAGFQCCESLRDEGYEGTITLIGSENILPYQRPPLSKDYLLGNTDEERILYRPAAFYEQKQIDVRLSTTVASIDPASQIIHLEGGEPLSYEALVLSTGAQVRKLDIKGAELDGVTYLRTLEDINDIGARLSGANNILVIGAGFIGLEFAAVASKLGKNVQVLEAAPRVMERVVQPEISSFFSELHKKHGVEIICNALAEEIIETDGRAGGAKTKDERSFEADFIVVGIGVIANTGLAEQAGLTCGNGVLVDGHSQTSDPHIYAIGDCASYEHPLVGQKIRLESVQNAGDQARAAAAHITGKDKPYISVPWFWSDQYDVKMQIAGLTLGCDRHIMRGDANDGKFSLFHFKGDVLRAVEAISQPRDYIVGRKLLEKGVSPSHAQVADTQFNLKSLM